MQELEKQEKTGSDEEEVGEGKDEEEENNEENEEENVEEEDLEEVRLTLLVWGVGVVGRVEV